VASMPHLSQLAREYREQGVTVIGVTAEDESNTLEKVHAMVKDKADGMDYTVAWDTGRDTYEAFMVASGQRGIPTSFLVDKAGDIAWIGHPMEVDIPLAMVVDGTWDAETGPALMKEIGERKSAIYKSVRSDPGMALELLDTLSAEQPLAVKGMDEVRFDILAGLPEHADEAKALGRRIVDEAVGQRNSGALNGFAWGLVDPEVERSERYLDLALLAAQKADEFSGGEDPAILDTLARAYAWNGDLEQALEIQRRAVGFAEGSMKDALAGAVAEYEAALEEAGS
jgi:hypothetical protein